MAMLLAAASIMAVPAAVGAEVTISNGSTIADADDVCSTWGAASTATVESQLYHVHCFNHNFGPGDTGDMWPPSATHGIIDCYSGVDYCFVFPPDTAAGDVNNDGTYDYDTTPPGSPQDVIDYWGWDCAALIQQFGADNAPPECSGESSIPDHVGVLDGWLKGSGCTHAGVTFKTSYTMPTAWGDTHSYKNVWLQCWDGADLTSSLGSGTDKWHTLSSGEGLVDCFRGTHADCNYWVKSS